MENMNTYKSKETSIHHSVIIINSWLLFFLYWPPSPHSLYWIIFKQISHSSIMLIKYIQYLSLKDTLFKIEWLYFLYLNLQSISDLFMVFYFNISKCITICPKNIYWMIHPHTWVCSRLFFSSRLLFYVYISPVRQVFSLKFFGYFILSGKIQN